MLTELQRPLPAPSASAQLAASQAFLANRTSNANLSNAAAAAALRSMTPTPTAVGEIQTKRRVQRESSVSSNGSAGSRGLQRRDSSGSMTERTFRSPSPNRPGSRDTHIPPPVPPLPKNYTNRRATSLEPPMRITSPTPTAPGGRGMSLDRGPAPKKTRPQKLGKEQETGRSDSRNSVNFSYPTHARPNSPPANTSPTTPTSKPKPRPTPSDGTAAQYSVAEAANRPVKKKKKKVAQGSAEGSHLAAGGMGGKPLGVEVDKGQAPVVKKPKKKAASTSADSESDSTPEKIEKRAQRSSGQLNKQPSIVREDWEGEQAADESFSPITTPPPISRTKQPVPNAVKDIEIGSETDATQDQPLHNEHLTIETQEPNKRSSLSPSRSTRFSAQLASELLAERRHEPPPRSLSPAKSAMKHHSPSSRTQSPVDSSMPGGWRRSSQTPSEASDTTSLASTEGSKKKRSMHVSFNSEPSVVAEGGDPAPLTKEKKSRFAPSTQQLDTIEAEDDMEEVMKPRPALPSFGSIRNKKEKPEIRPSRSSKTSISSSTSSSESYLPPTMETSVSSDHAIGTVLAQEHAKRSDPPQAAIIEQNLPLPPEVTSVEGTGYNSDTDVSTYSNDDVTLIENQALHSSTDEASSPEAKAKDLTIDTDTTLPAKPTVDDVPQIAVQPATPALEAEDARDEWVVNVPGGFPESREASENGSLRDHEQKEINVAATSPADIGIAEPKPAAASIEQSPSTPVIGSISQSLLNQPAADSDADSSAGESIYSDAAEDVTEFEGDGFGSINAIVDSPTRNDHVEVFPSPPASPVEISSTQPIPDHHDSWDNSQAHWTELAQRQRDTAQSPPSRSKEPVAVTKPKKKKKKAAAAPVSANPIEVELLEPESPVRAYPITSPYPLVNSRSGNPPNQGPMRQSMRSSSGQKDKAPLKESVRPPPKSVLRQSRDIPSPKPMSKPEPKGALQKKSLPAATSPGGRSAATAAASSTTSPKQKSQPLSNDSDSESSFRRERRPKKADGKYTMRRSMRSPLPEPGRPQSAIVTSLRPSSPQERRPFSAGGQGALRSTMRSSVDSGTPSLRGSRQRPASIAGFGKATKISSTPAPSAALTSRFKSRFASDSDDEDVPRVFHSRFEDSSDEEPKPLNLRPVRGIPHKTDEEDSTDLEDSSDEEAKAKQSKVQISSPKTDGAESAGLRRRSSGSGRDLSKSSDLPSPKRGIFGRLRNKKPKESLSRVSKSAAESPARRDTHLERSQAELRNGRNEPDLAKGKLQRRALPSRIASDSWPLPDKTDVDDRPNTSDGLGMDANEVTSDTAHGRPGLGVRENTSSTLKSEGGTPIYGRSGKKKRFPMLRKAFGLHD